MKELLHPKVIQAFELDFKALEDYQSLLLKHYGQERLKAESEITQKLYQDIGQPPKTLSVRVLGNDKNGDHIRNIFTGLLV